MGEEQALPKVGTRPSKAIKAFWCSVHGIWKTLERGQKEEDSEAVAVPSRSADLSRASSKVLAWASLACACAVPALACLDCPKQMCPFPRTRAHTGCTPFTQKPPAALKDKPRSFR